MMQRFFALSLFPVMMMKTIKIIGISLLALVVLAGSSGISLFIHACGSGKSLDYAFYPEYFSVGNSCCNPWSAKEMSSCSHEDHDQQQGLSKTDCCESLHVILKVQHLVKPVTKVIDLSAGSQVAAIIFKSELPGPVESDLTRDFSAGDPSPPPLSGRDLIISLQQIRIPS
jgi:hypothetical protein